MSDGQFLIGCVLTVATVILHVTCLVFLADALRNLVGRLERFGQHATNASSLVLSILALLVVHTMEAGIWATTYRLLGEFESFSEALYFSIVTATTLGYGDRLLSERWQLLGTFEAMGGLILFGVSTAFLLGVMRRIFEAPRGH